MLVLTLNDMSFELYSERSWDSSAASEDALKSELGEGKVPLNVACQFYICMREKKENE